MSKITIMVVILISLPQIPVIKFYCTLEVHNKIVMYALNLLRNIRNFMAFSGTN